MTALRTSGSPVGLGLLSPRWLLVAAFGLTLLAYVAVWRFDFVYDDHFLIQRNPSIRDWGHVPAYFGSHLWSSVAGFDRASNYYRPLFQLWLRLNYALFGLEAPYWHAASLALHLIATWLVFLAASKLLKLTEAQGDRETMAAVAALVFGLHPAHIEPVAWLSSSSELLLTIFFLAALVCHANQRLGPRRVLWIAASLAFFVLALLSKETAATLALIVLACEVVLRRRAVRSEDVPGRWRGVIAGTAPWFAVLAVYLVLRRLALGELGHRLASLSPGTVLKSAPALLWFYCRHLVWPYPLSQLYDVYYVESVRSVDFLLPVVALVLTGSAAFVVARHSTAVALATLWVVICLLPVLDVALLRPDALVQDRYLYLPSFGFCMLVGILLERLASSPTGRRRVAAPALALVVAAMGMATARQLSPWENDLLLSENAVAVAPNNAFAKSNLATELILRGENDRALRLLQASYALDPNAWATAFSLALVYYSRADLPQAEHYLQRAIAIDDHNRNQFLMLGITQKRLGKLEEAAVTLRKTAEIWPDAPYAHYTLGEVLEQLGRYDEALKEFEKERVRHPDLGQAGMTRVRAKFRPR